MSVARCIRCGIEHTPANPLHFALSFQGTTWWCAHCIDLSLGR